MPATINSPDFPDLKQLLPFAVQVHLKPPMLQGISDSIMPMTLCGKSCSSLQASLRAAHQLWTHISTVCRQIQSHEGFSDKLQLPHKQLSEQLSKAFTEKEAFTPPLFIHRFDSLQLQLFKSLAERIAAAEASLKHRLPSTLQTIAQSQWYTSESLGSASPDKLALGWEALQRISMSLRAATCQIVSEELQMALDQVWSDCAAFHLAESEAALAERHMREHDLHSRQSALHTVKELIGAQDGNFVDLSTGKPLQCLSDTHEQQAECTISSEISDAAEMPERNLRRNSGMQSHCSTCISSSAFK